MKYLKSQGCEQIREGSRHTVWWNPARRQTSAVPRHTEIVDELVYKICKDLGIPKA